MKKFTNPLLKLSAVASTWLLSTGAYADNATATDAAGGSFLDVANTASANIYAATNIISTAGYVMGAGFTVAALRGFQQHAENPGNHPIVKPLTKLVVGAGLVATPWVINTAFQSVGINEGQTVGVEGSSNRL